MDRKKSVLIITNDFYPSRGGIQETILGLASQFGDKCVVLAPYYSRYNIKMDEKFNFSIVRTNGLRQDRVIDKFLFLILRRPLTFFLRTFFRVYRTIAKGDFRIILCAHITNTLIGVIIKRFTKNPVAALIYGKEIFFRGVLKPLKKFSTRYLLNQTDVLFVSASFMKVKLSKIGIPQEKIIKIPFGVKTVKSSEFKNVKMRKKEKIILTIGRLIERKGHSIVINALPIIMRRFQEITYKIVGKGPMERILKELVKRRGLSKYVEFYGEVENTESFYQNCDIFVMPSKFIEEKGDVEGFGLVYLEANYFGKPVIAGRSGGVSDAVLDGVTGILVDPESSEEIANAIIKLLEKPKLADKLGEQGRKRVLTEFTWKRAASIIERKMKNG